MHRRIHMAKLAVLASLFGILVTLGIAAYFFGFDSRQMGTRDRVNAVRF